MVKKTKRVNRNISGGFLGFGSKKKSNVKFDKKAAKKKLKEVIIEAYKKILTARVEEQVKKNDVIRKYGEDMIKMDENLKNLVIQIQNKSNKKTETYKDYKIKNKWAKLVTPEEQKKVGELGYKQMEELKERYTDYSMSIDSLSSKLASQVSGKTNQRSYNLSSTMSPRNLFKGTLKTL